VELGMFNQPLFTLTQFIFPNNLIRFKSFIAICSEEFKEKNSIKIKKRCCHDILAPFDLDPFYLGNHLDLCQAV
jgi:queuine/archaeosine tRNA-ribosyltransferase